MIPSDRLKPYVLTVLALPPEERPLAPTYILRKTYIDLLSGVGLAPFGVPSALSLSDMEALYEQAAGIFLTGGSDIDPACYGAASAGAEAPFDPARDALELELVRRAAADRKPLLGICRGSQMLAVALGGTLYQDISTLAGEERHAPAVHRYEDTLTKPDTLVSLLPDSRLRAIIGRDSVNAPCNHHQSIKDLPAALRLAARSAAGISEAVEAVDPKWFAFGIQSHPETRAGGDFLPLFKSFAQACRLQEKSGG